MPRMPQRAAFPVLSMMLGIAALVVPSLAGRQAAAQGGWQPGPLMGTARASFPLIPLPSGDLLAAGGLAGGSLLGTRSAEVLDVRSAAWRSVAPMAAGHRYGHHGLSLRTGEALVVGEDDDPTAAPRAERFTEATGTWAPTANGPAIARFAAHLTLLADGRVLYAGGYDGGAQSDTYASAEVYDPAAGTWSATGDMASPRFGHGAVLLKAGPDVGNVLVAGGSIRAFDNALATCELYDPATGAWQPAAPMGVARFLFTLTPLPDGRVLAAGGLGDRSLARTASLAEAELYDPATGRWTAAAPMASGRARHTATLLPDGRVLVVGGSRDAAGDGQASAELYDPATDAWTAVPDLHTGRQDHEAALLPSGAVLVVGGRGPGGVPLAGTEVLTPTAGAAPTATGAPSTRPTDVPPPTPMPTASVPVAACPQLDGRVPAAVVAAALADPGRIAGYGQRHDPAKPGGPANPLRRWLSLMVLGRPYDRLSNGLVLKAGCP